MTATVDSRGRRRVVITGIGAVTPLGLSARETWGNALEGRSGVQRISLFDAVGTGSPVTIAAEVRGFDVTKPVGPFHPVGTPGSPAYEEHAVTQAANSKDARRVGRFVHLALAAGLEAYGDSGLDAVRGSVNPERMGVNIGVGMGGLPEIEAVHNDYLAKGYRRITPFFIPQVIANMASGQLSILLNLQGPNLCNVTACTSSAHALGESFRQIQRGEADIMIAGGAEAVISILAIGGFASMKALSTRNEEPEKASRPFDRDRDGFVMGEGAAVLILEDYEHAKKRGAKIYGEIRGYGLTGDAYHMTTPAPEGEGGRRAMSLALSDSGLNPEQIGYINAHGTSTPAGDVEEARAISRVFKRGSEHLHVSSTKSMTGHLLGAAGAVEAFFSIMAIREGKIPPTINLENLDPSCAELKLDFTANRAAEKKVDFALSNSFGFGGTNASLIFGKAYEAMRPRVLIASDHAGFELKAVLQLLVSGCEWIDLGPKDASRVDYPDFAAELARKIVQGSASQGVLICGSGIGMSIAANKIAGVRAATASDPVSARLAREHNDANILCLGARFLAPEYAAEIASAWLGARFDPAAAGGRHRERIVKISKLERAKK